METIWSRLVTVVEEASWPRRALFALTFVVVAVTVVAFSVEEIAGYVGLPVMVVGYGVGGVLFLKKPREGASTEARAWRLIGSGLVVGATGVVVVGVATGLGLNPPAFGPLDLFFITAYLLVLIGFWTLPHLEGPPYRRLRVFLDGAVGAVSIAVVAWVAALDDIVAAIERARGIEVAIATAYPLLDVGILVAVMLVTLRRSNYRFDPRMLLFGLGVSAQAIADLIFFAEGVGVGFAQTEPPYALYMLAGAALLTSAAIVDRAPEPREYAERKAPWWAVLAPYGAAAVLLVMLVVKLSDSAFERQTIVLVAGALVVMLLVFIRQGVSIRENRELVERQRTALVSSISHELRTPLTAMVGFLDILTDRDQHVDEASQHEMLGIVDQQARYMARIVSDLVMLNRRQPDMVLHFRSVGIESLIAAAVDSTDVGTASGVMVEMEPGLVGYVDPDRIQQVVVNLLTNAARYGGPHRLVLAKSVEDGLVIEVHDDGPGVPKRYELAIWDRFERGAHRYDAGIPGSGIGLAVVDMLVRGHGGNAIYRRSERLGGACFSISLPGRAGARVEMESPPVREVGDPAGSRRP
ncbi:MAG TPA: HAMP domain-containing sensor histidine kinase [Acidimicrobiia bacterium]|nr:HAMP domain-containing sensor histidine kinase [Acidimicrobiia bacterium]